MATQADVRRIALSFPESEEAADRFAFSVRNKDKLRGFVWVWMERIQPKKPRVPNSGVVAVRVASTQKDLLLSPTGQVFHRAAYNDFRRCSYGSSVASRPRDADREAWRCQHRPPCETPRGSDVLSHP